jgi:hypothetical protein
MIAIADTHALVWYWRQTDDFLRLPAVSLKGVGGVMRPLAFRQSRL